MKPTADLEQIIKEIERHGMRVWLISAFTQAFKEARKHKLKTFNEHVYEENWSENVIRLTDAVLERYYRPSSSISFVVFDPMIREIFAAPFVDRIVHHLLYELQGGWWDHRFIEDSYSCRQNKGTLYGVLRTQQMMRQVTNNFTEEAYVIKLDVQGYFMSLPRVKLYARVKWGLDQQFGPYLHRPAAFELYKLCCFLWQQVLFDDPANKSRRRGPLNAWDNLPPEKSLYTRPLGLGIVIGNLTSQLVSNIYLDQLDRFIKFELGYDFYGRYVDDFIFMVHASQYAQAKKDVKKIEKFMREELQLTLHPKKRYYQSVYKGVPFLGTRIYPHCLYPSNRIQQKFKKAIHDLSSINFKPETLISYLGFLKHTQSDKFVAEVFKKNNLDFNLYRELRSDNPRPTLEIVEDLRWQALANKEKEQKQNQDKNQEKNQNKNQDQDKDQNPNQNKK